MTDTDGRFLYAVEKPGLYSFRTYVEENESGKVDGQTYQQIRHHGTLTLRLPFGGQ